MRTKIINAIDDAVSSGARLFKACAAINLCERRLRRWRNKPEDLRTGGYRAATQKITPMEKNLIATNFSIPEVAGLSMRSKHAKLMDLGVYIASPATCIRVLNEQKIPEKERLASKVKRVRPELKATGPCQVWCWDITWLPSNVRGKYFYLYLIIDMYSRFIIDWEVHTTEDGFLARQLFARAFTINNIDENSLLMVHADNGMTMRSITLNELFHALSVRASHSRPHTSNDNAFAESIFSTMKGRVLYPECFMTIEGAETFVEQFVEWYNYEHKHSGLDLLSPYEVHTMQHVDILEKRNHILEDNRLLHPSRHGIQKKIYQIPEMVELKHRVTLKMVG
jgi:putative transposase